MECLALGCTEQQHWRGRERGLRRDNQGCNQAWGGVINGVAISVTILKRSGRAEGP